MGQFIRALLVIIAFVAAGNTAFAASPEADALFNQGKIYHDGVGVNQSYETARSYYERAAKLGSTDAQLNLGYLYFVGQGVKQNFVTAREWYEKAAVAGDTSAAQNLAYMDREGLGIMPQAVARGMTQTVRPKARTTSVAKTPLVVLPTPPNVARNIYVANSPLLATTTRAYASLVPAATPVTVNPSKAAILPPTMKTPSRPSLSAFTVFGAIIALALASAAALGWYADARAAKARRGTQELAQQFFEHNRRLLREIYIRYPSEMRDMGQREAGWAVAISVLIVRFVIFKNSDAINADPISNPISDKILSIVKTHPAKARHLAYRLVPEIITLIQSDIRAFDIEHDTLPEAPPIYKSPRVNPRKLVWEPRIVATR